jgi:hypothetical protein
MSTGTSSLVEPVSIGPTWQKGPDGKWHLPDLTLGWQALAWTAEYLRQPDGPDAGQPWRYTNEQARFILWWYAIDRAGRFIYRYAMLRRVKGWGKDPVGATICAIEFVGPCRFDGWDANGDPVAKPHPASWVLTAAVSKDQTRNTMTLFPGLFSDTAISEYAIDLGKEIIYADHGRCRLEAVTSSPRALEGPRSSFTLKNETQHWLKNNEGHAMAEVIGRNTTKSRDGAARVLAISNAHEPGEDSDAEHDYEAWQAIDQGRVRTTGFLYDSLEAPPSIELADETSLRAGLRAARGDSRWLDEDRHVEEIYDPRNSPSTSRRFYLNQIVAAEDAWITPQEWDALADPNLVLADGEMIALGFDGSKTDDHTALIAARIEDGAWFTLGVWDPAKYGGEAPRTLIDNTVQAARERYDVVAFFADLHPWESYVDKWAVDFMADRRKALCVKATPSQPVAWDIRGRVKQFTIEGVERLHDEIVEGAFRHDGDPRVRQHAHNARRRPNPWGVSFSKEHRESDRKIDAMAAGTLARMARRAYLALPKSRRRRGANVRANFW